MHEHPCRKGTMAAAIVAVVFVLGVCAGASGREVGTHVLVGVAPSASFGVAVDGEPLPQSAASDELGILAFRIDDASLPPGSHTVVVSLPENPVITDVTVDSLSPSGAIVRWRTNAPATSAVEYGLTEAYGGSTDVDPELVTEHEVSLDGLEPGLLYHFRAVSTDVFGVTVVSPDHTLETPPPPLSVSGVVTSEVGPTWASIEWLTSGRATSRVFYGTTLLYGESSSEDTLLVTEHSVLLTGLEDGTTHHFRVHSRDAFGQEAVSADSVFTTLEIQPTGPPVIGDVNAECESVNSVVITWTTDRPATSQVLYGTKGELDRSSAPDTVAFTEHSVRLRPVVPRHTYTFVVLSACGADTAWSEEHTFTAEPPGAAPTSGKGITIQRPGLLHVGETTASVAWVTDRPCSTWVECGTDDSFGSPAAPLERGDADRGGYGYCAELVGLAPGTVYYYRVCAWDELGGMVQTDSDSFRTEERADTEPPAPPGSLAVTQSAEGVSLEWSGCGEADLAGYLVYRMSAARPDDPLPGPIDLSQAQVLNSVPLTVEHYTDTTVQTGATYTYAVTAVDTCGNESSPSECATVSFAAGDGGFAFTIAPNPSHGDAALCFTAPAGADVTARIYTVGGRLVREITGRAVGGAESCVWDGRDNAGRPAGSGVYVCELSVGGAVGRRKMSLLR